MNRMWAYIVGGLCLAYFVGILIFGGVGSSFYFIWAVLAAAFLSYGRLAGNGFWRDISRCGFGAALESASCLGWYYLL